MKNYLKLIVLFVFLIPLTGNAESSISNDCYTFTKYLSVDVGVSSADVAALKNILLKEKIIDNNFKSTTYDENFASAVIDFQMKNGIQKTGTVGPITRAKLNSKYGCVGNKNTDTSSNANLPRIVNISGKALDSFEVSSGQDSAITGTNLMGKYKDKVKVYLNGIDSPITQFGQDLIYFTPPKNLISGSYYELYILNSNGKSNVVRVKAIGSNKSLSNETYSPSYSPTYAAAPSTDKKIEVLTPTNSSGVNSFEPGNTIKFNWSQSGIKGIKKIILVSSNGNESIYVLNLSSISNPLTTGTYNWIVPSSVKAGMYRVRIISDTSDVMGESSAKIVIRNSSPVTVQKEADKVSNSTATYSSTYTYTPSSTYTYTTTSTYTEKPKVEVVKNVTVLTPSGANGNKFNRGESMKIAWSSIGVRGVSLIKLVSSINSNSTYTVLDLTSPNSFPLTTDSYSWTVPTSINSGEYYVYVQIGNDSTAISNKSSGKITILEK